MQKRLNGTIIQDRVVLRPQDPVCPRCGTTKKFFPHPREDGMIQWSKLKCTICEQEWEI